MPIVPMIHVDGVPITVTSDNIIDAFTRLMMTGDAVVTTRSDLVRMHPAEDGYPAVEMAHEGALYLDAEAKEGVADAVCADWLEREKFTWDECQQACDGLCIDVDTLGRVRTRREAVRALMAYQEAQSCQAYEEA